MSYANAILYSSVLPSYDSKEDKEEDKFDPSIDANNPDLFKNSDQKVIRRR